MKVSLLDLKKEFTLYTEQELEKLSFNDIVESVKRRKEYENN